MKKALLYFFMFIFVMYFATVSVFALWKAIAKTVDTTYATIIASALYSIILLVLFIKQKWVVLSSAWFRKTDKSVLLWAGLAAIGTIIPFEFLQEYLPQLDDATATAYRNIINNPFGYITLCLLAPFVEETVFRGAILRSLLNSKINAWAAITISAILFAVAHFSLAQAPHAFIIGLLLGWMYYRTKSILTGVAFHWINNTIVYSIMVIAPQYENITMTQLFGSTQHALMAVGFSLCILLPAIFQLNARLRE